MREKDIPPWIKDAPELDIGLDYYYEIFWDLSTERQIGMGLGPIPHSAIEAYAVNHNFNAEEAHDLFYLIKRMDVAFLQYSIEKNSK